MTIEDPTFAPALAEVHKTRARLNCNMIALAVRGDRARIIFRVPMPYGFTVIRVQGLRTAAEIECMLAGLSPAHVSYALTLAAAMARSPAQHAAISAAKVAYCGVAA